MLFNKDIHSIWITKWWREFPTLAATLMLARGYTHPADWILDLIQNSTCEIFEDGLYEIYDFVYGVKTAEAKVFVFGINPQVEQQLKFKVCGELYQKHIKVVEIPSLLVRYEKIQKEIFEKGLEGFRKLGEALKAQGEENANANLHDTTTLHTTTIPTTSTTEQSRSSELSNTTDENLHNGKQQSTTPSTQASTSTDVPTTSTDDSNVRTNVIRSKRRKRPKKEQSVSV